MKTLSSIVLLVLFSTTTIQAQRKSDLLAKIESMKSEADSLETEIFKARKDAKVAQTRATSFEAQVTELQEANNTLMSNLTNFTAVSNKNSDIANSAIESLQATEGKLKSIKDAISKNDSTIIVVLTNVKQTMGDMAKVGVSEGAVVVSTDLATLYGSDTGKVLTSEAEPWAQKIAEVLKANPNTAIDIEGLSMTGDLELPAQQALALSTALQDKYEIDAERIKASGKDGNLKEGIQVRIHPDFNAFYLMVREEMKN